MGLFYFDNSSQNANFFHQFLCFQERLVLVVGSSIECMRTELRDKDGKFISSLTDDQATLEKLGVTDGMLNMNLL